MDDITKLKYTRDEIAKKRKDIYSQIIVLSSNIEEKTFQKIGSKDLCLIFELYDNIFFNNWFENYFKGKIKFSFSKRMTKSAGLTLCPKNISSIKPDDLVIEIRMSLDFFFNYGQLDRIKSVGGVETNNPLEALQVIIEHEICHVIEFIHYHRSSCRGQRFKQLAYDLFGHTESFHQLPTYRQIAKEKLGLAVGETVYFQDNNKKLKGIITNINKRATVMVKNSRGDYIDKKGNRYIKYYVPLIKLKS